MKSILFILSGVLVFCGCGTTIPGMVVQTVPFNPSGKTILIQHFDFYPEMATDVDRSSVAGFGEVIAFDVQNYLKKAGFRYPIVVKVGEHLEGDLLIKGTITRVSGGNVDQRIFGELFGFGATDVRARGEVVDLKTSRSLVGFSFAKQSRWTRLPNEAAVRENISEIAQEIAKVIIQRP